MLARKFFNEVIQWLTDAGVPLKEGMLTDAIIIEAPASTKNKSGSEKELKGVKIDWHMYCKN